MNAYTYRSYTLPKKYKKVVIGKEFHGTVRSTFGTKNEMIALKHPSKIISNNGVYFSTKWSDYKREIIPFTYTNIEHVDTHQNEMSMPNCCVKLYLPIKQLHYTLEMI